MIVEWRNGKTVKAFIMQLFRLFAIRFSQLRRGIKSSLDGTVIAHQAVTHDNIAACVSRDILFVRDHYDGDAAIV